MVAKIGKRKVSERVRITDKTPETKRDSSSSQMQEADFSQPACSSVDRILFLQRTIGNQAVRRLFKSGSIQAKLKIGQPGDIYEQEVDRVTKQVMRMPEQQAQRQLEDEEELVQAKAIFEPIAPVVQRQAKEEEEQEEEILPKGRTRQTAEVTPDFEASIQALRDNGQPLLGSTRAFFEPRFGYDFSRVHIHNDVQHELTHVLQQGSATAQRKLSTSKTNNFLERGANEVTSKITTGASHIQRQCTTAAGRVIFILYSSGIGSGCTYLRPGAGVNFLNRDTVTHTIRIRPAGLFTSSSFLINAGARVIVWVSRVPRVTGGSIIDNPGRRQTVHDVVVCP
jgi:hypothetical protein